MRWTKLILALSLVTTAMLATPALAVDPADQIGGSGPLQVNPTLGTIMFRLQQKSEIRFLRIPTDAERRKYDATRSFELIRARSKNPTLVDADFELPPLELYNFINTQMGPVFDKIDGQYVYLIAVRPGTYMLYGHMWLDGPGDAETCFCLGSVAFDVRAGQVVDIGRVRLNDDWDGPPLPLNPAGNRPFALIPPRAAASVSARLQGITVVPARFHATGKIPNFFGALIDRLPAIPGVLAYDRDTVIDVASGELIH